MRKKETLLVDFDETIFPFLSTYLKWVKSHSPNMRNLFPQLLYKELPNLPVHMENIRHKLHIEQFVNSSETLEIRPRKDATESLSILSSKYEIVCCTSRRNMVGTTRWIEKHYPDIIKNIEHVEDLLGRQKKIYTPFVTKKAIVEKTQAVALVDDFAFNMWGLPSTCRGFIVKREAPIPSDLGAISWTDIVKCLV